MSDEIHASFWEHLEELRGVLARSLLVILAGLAVSFYYHRELLDLLFLNPESTFYLFSPVEGFIAIFRLSFWIGLLGTSPYWMLSLLCFLQPALRDRERSWIPLFFALSFAFISLGVLICHYITLPLASSYLFTFNQSVGLNMWGFSAYLDFVLMLFFSHGIAFELGAILLFLIHKGLITSDQLRTKRRQAIVASLVIGALLTPPDVLTQLAIAIPLMGFYELAILYGNGIKLRVHE